MQSIPHLNELIAILEASPRAFSKSELHRVKKQISKKYGVPFQQNTVIFTYYQKQQAAKSEPINQVVEQSLKVRNVRTQSGITPLTLLTKPYRCPGKCVYCPTQPDMPKSYLRDEPAAQRAKLLQFDPYIQTKRRIEAFSQEGHPTDKIEIIVLGGTWSYYPADYQEWFIKNIFLALNEIPVEDFENYSLEQLQEINETANHRCIGLSLETRPDWINEDELIRMRKFGCTHVQVGVQTIYDDIQMLTKRYTKRSDVARATKLMKNYGFKMTHHYMPNLPGSNLEKDFKMFQEVFQHPDFKPDMIKLYPCSVVKDAQLYHWWKRGDFKPYTTSELAHLITRIQTETVPPWVRIMRLIRDIPGTDIVTGNKVTNLRQIVEDEMKANNQYCQCIRCREVKDAKTLPENLELKIREYEASAGTECFISYESENSDEEPPTLYGFVRLRLSEGNVDPVFLKPGGMPPGMNKGSSVKVSHIRELHVYGVQVPIAEKHAGRAQHIGLGKKLMKAAEELATEKGYGKMAVISGIGVRGYYRKLGYELEGTYMVKSI